MQIKITDFAKKRIDEIDYYYQEKGFDKYGKELRRTIIVKTKLLIKNPQMGQIEENLSILKQGHRYMILESKYKLIYLITDHVIYITDIFDTRQDPDKIHG